MFALKYLFKGTYSILKTANGRHLLKLMFKYGNISRYSQRNISFLNYKFIVPDCMSFLFQFHEIFVEEFYKFTSEEKDPIILDCGANIGTSCVYFKKLYPTSKIIAFEADLVIADILKSNIEFNKIANVEIINKAVWINDNGVSFASEGSDGSSIFGIGDKVIVPSIRLKDILDQMERVDILKMDIEGAENEVLIDCKNSLNHVKNIFIEYHSFPNQNQKLNEILEVLSQNGFRYYINSIQNRKSPLINHYYKNNDFMDLQLNIFGYKNY